MALGEQADTLNLSTAKENNFNFIINKFPDLTLNIKDVNLPGASIGTSFMQTPFMPIKRPGTSITYNPLVIGFIVDEDFSNWLRIFEWVKYSVQFKMLITSKQTTLETAMKDLREAAHEEWWPFSDCTLICSTNNKNFNLSIQFQDAFPIEVGDIQMSTSGDTEIISSCTLEFIDITWS